MTRSFPSLPLADEPAPRWWARGPHAQTLLGRWVGDDAPRLRPGQDGVVRQLVELDDGDRLSVLEAAPRTEPSGLVCHLVHGLCGDADSGYIRRMAEAMRADGHVVRVVELRGAGHGKEFARRPYNSGSSLDIAAALRDGRAAHPEARHLAVAVSLGANATLLLLGRDRVHLPDAAIAIAPPVDLARCCSDLRVGANRMYDRYFVKECVRMARELVPRARWNELEPVGRGDALWDFDDRVTAPLGGFDSAEDYYARCSAGPHLASITTPTWIVTAADDPLVAAEATRAFPRSSSVELTVTERGGHVGFLGRGAPLRWLEAEVVRQARLFGQVALP